MTTVETIGVIYGFLNLVILGFTIKAISHSPVNAVRVGRTLNTEQQKDNAKRNLFLLLFSLRGNPVHYDFVRGLNQIDVVFEDSSLVLAAWHQHLRDLNTKGLVDSFRTWELSRIELLSRMGEHLQYGSLRQTNILEHYFPEGHDNQLKDEYSFRESQRSYFDNQGLMAKMLIERMIAQDNR